ncbi:unnamed protein product [Cuscuta campestris]|uniref:Replication protein A OB domain-containing protein n=1 Tax=Cuscuta campestris TaxID=132261 RepID=A0A484KD71_9ASTE|nr:unnamed protein product [Cuscuta campestris]
MIQNQPILNDQVLIDVIGKVVGRSKVQTHIRMSEKQKLMEITLEDHEGNRLGCTLWGEYVERFLGCLTQNVQEPVILLFSFCKPKRYMGTVTVSTSFHVTNMIFDGNSVEVNAFRAMLPLHVDDGGPVVGLMLAGGDDDHGVMTITTIRNLLETTKPEPY